MSFNPPRRTGRPHSLGEAFRLAHERWLNHAVRHRRRYPVIPSIRVEAGGFDRLRQTALGQAWAEQWWDDTFRAMDAIDR